MLAFSRLKNAKKITPVLQHINHAEVHPYFIYNRVYQISVYYLQSMLLQFQFTLISALYYFHEIYQNDPPGIAPLLENDPPPKKKNQDFENDPPSTMAASCRDINPHPPTPPQR